MKFKVIFMGTPDFAVPCLRALVEMGENVVSVITQPDREKGRGKKIQISPVKKFALAQGLPVLQPDKVKQREFKEIIKQIAPDLIVVVAYGQILDKEILEIPPYGCINVHASLLPKYRGAAPIQHAILNGEKITGITTMYMDEGMDTGDIIYEEELVIKEEETFGELHDRMALLGAKTLIKTIEGIKLGKAPRISQNEQLATYAPKIKKEDERIDWTRSAEHIYNQIRALYPFPGAYTEMNGKIVKITKAKVSTGDVGQIPGTIIKINPKEGFFVQSGEGSLFVEKVKPEGKKEMTVKQYLLGNSLKVGELLG